MLVAAGERYKNQAALKKYVRVQAIPVRRDEIKKMVNSVNIDISTNENLNDDSILSGDFPIKPKTSKIKNFQIINKCVQINKHPRNVQDFVSYRDMEKKS